MAYDDMDQDRLPPPSRSKPKKARMAEEDLSVQAMMSQIAGRGQPGAGGMQGPAQAGGDEQAASLVMQGVQSLVQAAQMNPALQDAVRQAVMAIQGAVQQLAGPPPSAGRGGKGGGRKQQAQAGPPQMGGPGPGMI